MPKAAQPVSGPFARAVSAEVRAAMARQRMTMKGLASKAGMSESYLGKRLRDLSPLTANDIEALCKVLGEDIFQFISAALDAAKEKGQDHA